MTPSDAKRLSAENTLCVEATTAKLSERFRKKARPRGIERKSCRQHRDRGFYRIRRTFLAKRASFQQPNEKLRLVKFATKSNNLVSTPPMQHMAPL